MKTNKQEYFAELHRNTAYGYIKLKQQFGGAQGRGLEAGRVGCSWQQTGGKK